MGDVYEAENSLIGRQVAIKILHEQHARNPDVSKRFLGEAQVASLVRHKNVVDVLDMGADERGTPFIVQELLTGEDLRARLEKHGGRVTPEQAIPLLLPVIDAVAHAHTKGVVHRDLKPANIFLARESGRTVPKLLDFGISRVDGMHMTATGASMGTPAYMSPELVQGAKDADARTDVWALGVILFEMMTGTMPFDADSPGGVFVKIVTTDAPPLETILPSISPSIARVVNRCMRRDRNERYANAAELARDLHNVLQGRALETVSRAGSSQRLVPAAAPAAEATRVGAPALEVAPSPGAAMGTAATQHATPALEIPTLDHEAIAALSSPKPKAKPPPARASQPELAEHVATPGLNPLDDDAGESSALRLASVRPPAPSMSRLEPEPAVAPLPPPPFPHPLPLAILVGAMVIGALVLSLVSPLDDGLPLAAWLGTMLCDAAHVVTAVVGLALAAGGATLIGRGVMAKPVAIGYVVGGAGLLSLALVAVVVLTSDAMPPSLPTILALGATLAPIGLAIVGVQDYVRLWLKHEPQGRMVRLFVATLGLFLTIQMLRGADVEIKAPPTSVRAP